MSFDGFGSLLSMCVVEFPVGMTQCLDFLVCYGLLLPVSAASIRYTYPLACVFFSLLSLFSFQGIVESSPSGLDSYCLRQASATTS